MTQNLTFALVPEWAMVMISVIAALHWVMVWRESRKPLYLVMAGPVMMMALYYLDATIFGLDQSILAYIWVARLGTACIMISMMLLARQLLADIRKQNTQITQIQAATSQHNDDITNSHDLDIDPPPDLGGAAAVYLDQRQPATHQYR